MSQRERYEQELLNFQQTVSLACRLSASVAGREVVDWRLQYGSFIFVKACLHGISLRKIAPSLETGGGQPELEFWDMSSMCALARCIMDCYFTLFYLMLDPISDEELEFRRLVWCHHSEAKRYEMLRRNNYSPEDIANTKKDADDLLSHAQAHPCYQKLTKSKKKLVAEAKDPCLATKEELCIRAGVANGYYRTAWMMFSNYTHTHPFALSQIMDFGAGKEEALHLLSGPLQFSTAFLSLSILAMMKAFPDAQTLANSQETKRLGFWQNIASDFDKHQPGTPL
jgi:hypothetical protein